MCVDLETGKVNATADLEGALGRGVAYVLAIDTRDAVKDVTRRYAASHFMTQTREGLFMVINHNYSTLTILRLLKQGCGSGSALERKVGSRSA